MCSLIIHVLFKAGAETIFNVEYVSNDFGGIVAFVFILHFHSPSPLRIVSSIDMARILHPA